MTSRSLDALPRRSARFFRGFRKYARRYIRKNFHAMRIDAGGTLPDLPDGPLIVVMNHPSWWDPLTAVVLSGLMPDARAHYAPMDAGGLAQYRFMEWLGIFGIELGTTRGSLVFLRKCNAVLARPESVLWITAQGRFADVRDRPTRLKEGIGHLLHRASRVSVVPLAIEYPFWNDRLPELLVRFGPLIDVDDGAAESSEGWTRRIESALEAVQNQLAESACRRDPAAFNVLIGGTAGVGGFYDVGRRFLATIRGKPFVADHQAHES
ncbi:MAG: lysophospholipid acyltransferase family protein [Paludisphaera borealis]|uniref:lysophospholipid acyltransferase family protein n=1 Tax=Paludisphaera borealis TaxID=1387353 RepID=UPI00283E1928|nr:lysophospholipid acyltransferase family protein [Paludisphaera borealis]MDR3622147.1 lysophospholipid acyltransferase family protein [Paludisphaera borealis]